MRNLNYLTILIAIAMASCSSVKVVTDQDKSVDFTQYKTYNFLGWQDDSDKMLSSFDKKRIKESFKKEMDARGMTYAEENGDIAITLFVVVDQQTSTTAYTDYYGRSYRGYRRYRGGWGHGYATTTYTEEDYLQGTLVVDVFDGDSKDQVWQGIAKSTIDENPSRREKTIPKKINALMKKFPVSPVK
ncbi:DUF4136 domain-containing protein [Labilibacter sediminis]|nr:DUF4136 domain-containing protein [Labilibacter sediminis]